MSGVAILFQIVHWPSPSRKCIACINILLYKHSLSNILRLRHLHSVAVDILIMFDLTLSLLYFILTANLQDQPEEISGEKLNINFGSNGCQH